MGHLTITEKEHWKQRISRRIDKAIEKVYSDHPGLRARITDAARMEALRSLGLVELQQKLNELIATAKRVSEQQETTRMEMWAAVKGLGSEHGETYSHWAAQDEVKAAIEGRQMIHEEELLARDPHGERILELRREKEALLDTVWLATSGKQIKELWQSVSSLLNEELTQLQSHALRIDPVENGST